MRGERRESLPPLSKASAPQRARLQEEVSASSTKQNHIMLSIKVEIESRTRCSSMHFMYSHKRFHFMLSLMILVSLRDVISVPTA